MARKYRMAAIDVGTNSIHMIIVESQRLGYRVIDKEKEMVQLGRGSLQGKPLTAEAMDRAVAALTSMCEIARRWGVDDIVAVATSAVREASNRRTFIRAAEKAAGIRIRVISGEEEADLINRAVRSAVDFQGGTALAVDIGGGSVELIVGTREEVFLTASEPLGALRMSQMFLEEDPPAGRSIEECRQHIRKTLKKSAARIRILGFDFCVGTSGTILTLAELATGSSSNDASGSAGLRWLSRSAVGELVPLLGSLAVRERADRFGLDMGRAENILAGAIVLEEVMSALKVRRLRACSAALREGIVERALEEKIAHSPQTGSVRRKSVMALAERSDFDRTHALHVARLALRLFDQTAELHELRPADRELLEYSALLHEIGVHVSFQGHHKHSYYLIRHAGLAGFTEDQIAILANVARYHRKSVPSREHPNFAELSSSHRTIVERLAAILRIASGFDRGRRQSVRDIAAQITENQILLEVRPRSDAAVEIRAATSRAKYLGRLFDRSVRIDLHREE